MTTMTMHVMNDPFHHHPSAALSTCSTSNERVEDSLKDVYMAVTAVKGRNRRKFKKNEEEACGHSMHAGFEERAERSTPLFLHDT